MIRLDTGFEARVIGYMVSSNGDEYVACELANNKATPFVTWRLAPFVPGEFNQAGRGCLWGNYLTSRHDALENLLERAL